MDAAEPILEPMTPTMLAGVLSLISLRIENIYGTLAMVAETTKRLGH